MSRTISTFSLSEVKETDRSRPREARAHYLRVGEYVTSPSNAKFCHDDDLLTMAGSTSNCAGSRTPLAQLTSIGD
jgi:hypothetical protein